MSSDTAIHFRGVGKRYRIGAASGQRYKYVSLGEQVGGILRNPFRAAKNAVRRGDEASFWALKDVSFEVPRGEVVGVIGRNGAGKSTLLKVLSQITKPTEGEIEVRGRVGSLLEVGTGFHPELTGRENVFLNGAILGMTRQEVKRKFDEIVDFSEIERFLDTPVKQYSSGMYTRLAFAVAAHLDPEILVVDEVLAVGDSEFQKKCLGKMQEVSRGGRTILFVSHNEYAIRNLCTTCVWLDSGEVREHGECHPIIDRYQEARYSSNQANPPTGDLSGPLGLGNIHFRSGGLPVGEIATHDQVSLRVEILCESPPFSANVNLYRDDGLRISNLEADSKNFAISPGDPRRHVSEYRISSLALEEGQYYANILVSDSQGRTCHGEAVATLGVKPRSVGSLYKGKTPAIYAPGGDWSPPEDGANPVTA